MLSNVPNSTAGSERTHVTANSPECLYAILEKETSLTLKLDFGGWRDTPASTLEYETSGATLWISNGVSSGSLGEGPSGLCDWDEPRVRGRKVMGSIQSLLDGEVRVGGDPNELGRSSSLEPGLSSSAR